MSDLCAGMGSASKWAHYLVCRLDTPAHQYCDTLFTFCLYEPVTIPDLMADIKVGRVTCRLLHNLNKVVNGRLLEPGDGAAVSDENQLRASCRPGLTNQAGSGAETVN